MKELFSRGTASVLRTMESLLRQSTWFSLKTDRQKALILRSRMATALKLLRALPGTSWSLPGIPEAPASKQKIHLTCGCGKESLVRVSDVVSGGTRMCRSCAMRIRMRGDRRLADSGSAFRAAKKPAELLALRKAGQSAKDRCVNKGSAAYANYGARGIEFRFASAVEFAEYVVNALGGRPSPEHSIDRIDNDGHYERGNLRWASKAEQAMNKREYRRSPSGERIRALQERGSEFGYERLREFIKTGMSDDEILSKKKSTSGRPRK